MNWKAFKDSRCPKCSGYLTKGGVYICNLCGFKISIGKAITMGIKDLEATATRMIKNADRMATK